MKILHVFRAPIGGLFRHVRDLARGQSELGHDVGLLCDSTTGGDYATKLLEDTLPYCKLGIERRPISRLPGIGDLGGAKAAHEVARKMGADVLHGHGAKGGAYARLAGWTLGRKSFYTPHGGSLHFETGRLMQNVLLNSERLFRKMGTGLCFVCDYEKQRFDAMIGLGGSPSTVVHNGLWDIEFKPVPQAADATDFVFIGEMRDFKGVDILLDALALLPGASLTLVGDGPSMDDYKQQAERNGLGTRTRFTGRRPMSEAASMGRIMVLPSRFESFPYVVLETAAAGLPLITTAVGGIPEVVPADMLCHPLTVENLAQHMRALRDDPNLMKQQSLAYAAHIRKTCSAPEMARKISAFYLSA